MVKVIKIGEEDEETKVAEDVTTQKPVIDEEPITTELDYKIKQKFVKRVYYSIIGFLYLIICAYLVDAIYYVDGIDIITGEEYSLFGFILWVILMALIILPGVLIMLGFASGGVLIGVGGILLYYNIDRGECDDCETSDDIEHFTDIGIFIQKMGYGFIIVGGILVALGI